MEYDILDDKTVKAGSLTLSNQGVKNLKISRGWAMFVGIVGIIGSALMFVAAIVILVMGASIGGTQAMSTILGILYLLMSGINLIPIIFCVKFASKAGIACNLNDNGAFNTAIGNLKTMFKSTGIIIICVISLYIIGIIVAIIFGLNSVF